MELKSVIFISLITTAVSIMVWTGSLINALNGFGFVIYATTNTNHEFWIEYLTFVVILGIQIYAILKKK